MSLLAQISDDLKKAMLARDAARVSGLRMIRAAFIELEKSGQGEVTDARAVEALRRLKKQRDDSITAYMDGNRPDLADVERAELVVIEAYLPKLADEATTAQWVAEAVLASGATSAKEVGKVMGALMKAHKDELDGSLARTLITKALGG